MPLDLSKIQTLAFPDSQYYKEAFEKTQVVLHHTASGRGVNGDYRWWLEDPARIATSVIIDRDGTINQLFAGKYWGHHIGCKEDFLRAKKATKTNKELNQHSIGIEIDAWGQLTQKDGRFYSYTGAEVPLCEVATYETPFRGHRYYQCYTPAQINSVRDLLLYWGQRNNIPLSYNEDMWDVSKRALDGEAGIWTHVSYRDDKCDCHPQPSLIKMLKGLSE